MVLTIGRYGAYLAPHATELQSAYLVLHYKAIALSDHREKIEFLIRHPNGDRFIALILSGHSLAHAYQQTGINMILPRIPCDMPLPYPHFLDDCQSGLEQEFLALVLENS